MVRAKAKKAKKGDEALQRRKQKVGRKKLRPVTETRADVHSFTLRIKRPRDAMEDKLDEETARRHPRRSFAECIAGASHYRPSNRAASLASLLRFVSDATPLQRLGILDVTVNSLLDTAADVRCAALKLGEAVLKRMSAISQSSEILDLQLVLRINIALTHADVDVRSDAMHFLAFLLTHCPSFLGQGSSRECLDDGGQVQKLFHYCVQANRRKTCPAMHLLIRRLFLDGKSAPSVQLPSKIEAAMVSELTSVNLPALISRWSTLMEDIRVHKEKSIETAVHVALCIGDVMEVLSDKRKLTPKHIEMLRCMLRRVPVSIQQLAKQGTVGSALAVAIASAILPAAAYHSAVADAALACIGEVFAQPKISASALRLLERAIRECASFVQTLPSDVLKRIPKIIEEYLLVNPSDPNAAAAIGIVEHLVSLPANSFGATSDSTSSANEAQWRELGAALGLFPKWIFFIRRLNDGALRERLTWRLLAILHDVLRTQSAAARAIPDIGSLPSVLSQLATSDILCGSPLLQHTAHAAAFYAILLGSAPSGNDPVAMWLRILDSSNRVHPTAVPK